MKHVQVFFPNGTTWDIPADVIARHRAEYYDEHDPDASFEEEFEYAINDEYELVDWASNNMNWEDVEEHATQVAQLPTFFEYDKYWTNADKEIVEY